MIGQDHKTKRTNTVLLTWALSILFIPIAFCDEYIAVCFDITTKRPPGWMHLYLVVDTLLLAALGIFGSYAINRLGIIRVRKSWYLIGATTMLILDYTRFYSHISGKFENSVWLQIGISVPYALSLAILAGALGGVNLRRDRPRHDFESDPDSGFHYVLPLVIGTFFAYIASGIWEVLPRINEDPSRHIDQEYFAQASQIILLLLIAMGFEAHHFQKYARNPIGKASAIVTIVILCIAEAATITVLPLGNGGTQNKAATWIEYVAFITSIEACFVGLTMLLWALAATQYHATPPSLQDINTNVGDQLTQPQVPSTRKESRQSEKPNTSRRGSVHHSQ
jgi:hypothetical protein